MASHLFAVAMVVLMVNLGFWQLRRLDERQADKVAIASAMSQAPVDIAEHLDASERVREYTAVSVTGTYRADAEVRIGNRSSGGQPGYWLATPLELDDGRDVAVVRGWIPRRAVVGLDDRSTAPPAGSVTVVGLAFGSVGGGRVAVTDPGETPEISRMDLDRFTEVSGVEVQDAWIRPEDSDSRAAREAAVPVPDPDLSDGPHLSYAFQWFFFSAGSVVGVRPDPAPSRHRPRGNSPDRLKLSPMARFGRVLTAMVTPFTEEGALDLDGAARLAQWLVAHGNEGLVVAGTTGESPTLTHAEQADLVAAVVAAVDVPVIAGAGSNDTRAAIDLTERCTEAGATGILHVTGYYTAPSQAGLDSHFRHCAAATHLPVIIYDIPGRTARKVATATVARLAHEVPNIVGLKDAAGSPAETAPPAGDGPRRLRGVLRRRLADPAAAVDRSGRCDRRGHPLGGPGDGGHVRTPSRAAGWPRRPPSTAGCSTPTTSRPATTPQPGAHQVHDAGAGAARGAVPPAHGTRAARTRGPGQGGARRAGRHRRGVRGVPEPVPEILAEPRAGVPEILAEPRAGVPEILAEPRAGVPEILAEPRVGVPAEPAPAGSG